MWSIERGDRPVKLAEAVDLAQILGVPLERLLTESTEFRVEQELRALTYSYTGRIMNLGGETAIALGMRDDLNRLLSKTGELDEEIPTDVIAEAKRAVEDVTPEEAVRLGRALAETPEPERSSIFDLLSALRIGEAPPFGSVQHAASIQMSVDERFRSLNDVKHQ